MLAWKLGLRVLKRVVEILYREPVAFLAVVVGVTTLLAKEGVIAGWIPLVALAVAAAIQRNLVEPIKSDENG